MWLNNPAILIVLQDYYHYRLFQVNRNMLLPLKKKEKHTK